MRDYLERHRNLFWFSVIAILTLMAGLSWGIDTGELVEPTLTARLDLPERTPAVVDFAASWCQPCHTALPRLQKIAENHPKLAFRVVCIDESKAACERLFQSLDIQLPWVFDGDHSIVERFAPKGFPATYVLDEQSQIVHYHTGSGRRDWNDLAQVLEGLSPAAALPAP